MQTFKVGEVKLLNTDYAYLSFSCLISGYQFYSLIVFFSAIPAQ